MWWFFTRNAEDEAAVARFHARLWMPPPSEKGKKIERGPWSAEGEMAAFGALKAATTSRPASSTAPLPTKP